MDEECRTVLDIGWTASVLLADLKEINLADNLGGLKHFEIVKRTVLDSGWTASALLAD